MQLIIDNFEALKHQTEVFDFENPPCDPELLFHQMRDIMCTNRGIGLAAPQVGLTHKMFVIGNPDDKDSCIAVYNPSIVSVSDETIPYEEGCLSFPGLFISIKRPRTIRARFANEKGIVDTMNFDGLTARVFQHEYDHLQGIVFTNRANFYNLDKARKNRKLMNRRLAKSAA